MINYLRFIPLFFILLIGSSSCNVSNQLRYIGEANKAPVDISSLINANETTLICVRHAEKQKDDNPSLTDEGRQRAQDLSKVLSNVKVDAIYSSDYNRTVQTAQPLSDKTKLSIQSYDARKINDLKNTILSNHKNEVVVIVGHSNTTPKFANKVLGKNKYSSFDESDYDNIFVISVNADGVPNIRLLEYGAVNSGVAH